VGSRREVAHFGACLDMQTADVQRALDHGAPDPRTACKHPHLDYLSGWDDAELLPGTVLSMVRALQRERTYPPAPSPRLHSLRLCSGQAGQATRGKGCLM